MILHGSDFVAARYPGTSHHCQESPERVAIGSIVRLPSSVRPLPAIDVRPCHDGRFAGPLQPRGDPATSFPGRRASRQGTARESARPRGVDNGPVASFGGNGRSKPPRHPFSGGALRPASALSQPEVLAPSCPESMGRRPPPLRCNPTNGYSFTSCKSFIFRENIC